MHCGGRHGLFHDTSMKTSILCRKTGHKFSFDHDPAARIGTFSALTRAINR